MNKAAEITPIGLYLIKVLDEVEKMKGSILLPETTSKERGNIGIVVKVPYNEPNPIVGVGCRVMFSKYSGTIIQDKLSADEYRLIKESDILGFFPDGDDS